jgi:prevent-host-death family protein
MPKTIPQRQLRNDNAQIIDAVASGETFVVTRNGVPVAELGPVRGARRTFVQKGDLLSIVFHGPRIDFEQFRTDLDRAIDQSL